MNVAMSVEYWKVILIENMYRLTCNLPLGVFCSSSLSCRNLLSMEGVSERPSSATEAGSGSTEEGIESRAPNPTSKTNSTVSKNS